VSRFDRQNLKKTPRLALRVSEHAVLRFRERVEEEFMHRGDDDLADLLNERIRAAVFSRTVVDPRDPGAATSLHLFESRTGMRLVAVVRDKTVVTVLDDWMARNNYPGWEDGSISRSSPALSSPLARKLRDLGIVIPKGSAAGPSVSDLTADPVTPPVEVLEDVPSTEALSNPSGAAEAAVEVAPLVVSTETVDMYGALAAECRTLGQRLRSLREHRSIVDLEIEAVLKDYDEKRERLIAIMNEGSP
jgi:hypothetical protein